MNSRLSYFLKFPAYIYNFHSVSPGEEFGEKLTRETEKAKEYSVGAGGIQEIPY